MNVLYIGAGLDTSILKSNDVFFDNVNMFVFVDSLPKSYGRSEATSKNKIFIKKLIKTMRKIGYILNKQLIEDEDNEQGLIIFHSIKNKLYYFYSTIIDPFAKNPTLDNIIKSCNVLYVQGHNPARDVISEMNKPIVFIGGTNTVFSDHDSDTEDECTVFDNLEKHVNSNDISLMYSLNCKKYTLSLIDYKKLLLNGTISQTTSTFF
jgi:hypothetical protein